MLCLLAATCGVAAAETEETVGSGGERAPVEATADESRMLSDEELADDADGSGGFLATDIVDDEIGEQVDSPEGVFIGPPIPEQTGESVPEGKNTKPRVAENIDLSQPVAPSEGLDDIDIGMIAPPLEPTLAVYAQKSLMLLGAEVGCEYIDAIGLVAGPEFCRNRGTDTGARGQWRHIADQRCA